jgi:isocitrate lyase
MGGKVLVDTATAVQKLVAARLAADVLNVPTLIVARTDAMGASLLTSDNDANDKPFCNGKRTVEGFYETRQGLEQAISRGLAYAPYADLVWCETSTPDLAQAKQFADAIRAKYPGKALAYNCSPSFNWKKNLDEATIAKFQTELGELRLQVPVHHAGRLPRAQLFDVVARERLQGQADGGLRRAAGGRVRGRVQGLQRRQAPARGRHRLLRPGERGHRGGAVVALGAARLDRGGAVPRRSGHESRGRMSDWLGVSGGTDGRTCAQRLLCTRSAYASA